MVSLSEVRAANAQLVKCSPGGVYVFVGATSGIGENALRKFARLAAKPRVYIVGRNLVVGESLLRDLRESNPDGEFIFIHKDISLVKDAEDVCAEIASKETRLDLLFLSAGYFPWDGRQDTVEGLDAAMATRYYTRILLAKRLAPLLEASPAGRVVSVLYATGSTRLVETDLGLESPENYSMMKAGVGTATMNSLALHHLAILHPRVSFVHTYPGVVRTKGWANGGRSFVGLVVKYVLAPLTWPFALSVDEAGDRALYTTTSEQNRVDGSGASQVILVNWNNDTVQPDRLTREYMTSEMLGKVWDHTEATWKSILGK
ncbi:uncharacterized protein CIMG_06107 [Coccidioides immitis RS]|uniref:Short-chain dehydrogenase/reductase n=2 Tax=Coccidioides immitis TaxID=5501 RepID=A0A0E1RVT4_COCIM|nr:uncharacterized protein CIMG_06107 [Coccidioides immitis RS]EAS30628.1 hypothetical protein CIMG_06107 [Coccidioides immitis RS]KMP03183.1 hypothetical protein CIRG_02875 [Coccidioides immitis RMSCC 2394]TPX23555.1 hypothetical protein DIZ76_012889 [Coccidioides immitis]